MRLVTEPQRPQSVTLAIQFARARYISRNSGGSAVRSAAYNGREEIEAERTGEVFYFRHRDAPEYHTVLLPEGAAARFAEAGVLWNAAEAAERRKDAQVAREIVLALPANAEVSTEDRIAMARSFAEMHFVSKGLAVQLDVHAPHEGDAESERANWHAHLLITTRRLEGEQFDAKKARDLDPEVRLAGGRPLVSDGAVWGELWREHQDQYFREHGLDARVDPRATHAQEHIGPVRMRVTGAEIVERAEIIRQANQAAARDPDQVLATLTRNNATFTARDLDRHLSKQLGNEGQEAAEAIAAVRTAVLQHRDLVPLHDRETGAAAERFTTHQVRAEEVSALADADGMNRARSGGVSGRSVKAARAGRTLRPDQDAALAHATGAGNLKLIEGRAGTGKSYTLAAIRDAHAADGKRVVGLAPTNAVAQDLVADGFSEAGTVHAALFGLKNGRTRWDRNTVVVVDEAAMLDTPVTGELLAAARQAGAKLILTGDDRQLASIERGGLFSEMRQRHGAAEITEVTRQKVDWQRQAARDLAEGRFAEAVNAFDRAGAITWTGKQEDARRALVAAWTRDAAEQPGASRFVFAYTNRDVDALNAELRQVRRERGELTGADVAFNTKHGVAAFAVGDRVQFTDTDKRRHIYNGNAGTITGFDAGTGQITVRLDAASGAGRDVTWSAHEFEGFRHGYAGTIYKGQGKTLDRTYLYHTEHWRAAASYVALTRQRDSAQVFVARETARDAAQLARQMGRGEVRAASIAWATREEVSEVSKIRAERQAGPSTDDRKTERIRPGKDRDEDSLRAKVRDALTERRRVKAEMEKPEAAPVPDAHLVRADERQADSAAAYWKATTNGPDKERGEDSLRAKVREALAARQGPNAQAEKTEAPLSPDAHLERAGQQEKSDRAFTGSAEERTAMKADAARPLAAREAGEGPVVPADGQHQAAVSNGPEDERTPAALLPAWRDTTGQGRDSFGRGTSQADLVRVADQDPAALREVEAQKRAMRATYRDPEAAAGALEALIRKSGNDLRAVTQTLRQDGPEVLGALRGREGWLASEAAKTERTYARNAARTVPASLDQQAGARDAAVRSHTTAVEQQRTRDAVEVPGLSKASLAVLDNVQTALRATEQQHDGERYDAKLRRREEMVAGVWTAGRADPRVAGELDRFMAAVGQRLGEEGTRDASRAAGQEGRMTVPGAGPEQQAGLDVLARSFRRGREGTEQNAAWGNRLGREAQAAERERTRQEERQRQGLPPEPPREQQSKGLGLSR
jgi:Ti-type conjugative transfer relaxase TraA